jgi:hypothetical protein
MDPKPVIRRAFKLSRVSSVGGGNLKMGGGGENGRYQW